MAGERLAVTFKPGRAMEKRIAMEHGLRPIDGLGVLEIHLKIKILQWLTERHRTVLGQASKRNHNGWKRTTDGPQTGDQIRPLAEEVGKEPDRIEDQQEEGRSPPIMRLRP